MIEIRDLELTINKHTIFKNVNLSIPDGTVCGIIGDNGSGKTMLLKCISGLIPYSSGQVMVDGDIIGKDVEFPKSMGLLIEVPQFISRYSAKKNLSILAGYRNTVNKEEIQETLKLVGLDPNSKKSVKKYSLGMRQRLGIAQAIMENPKLMILDEPFNSIDSAGVERLTNLLRSYKNEGKIIIITSHYKRDIEAMCDMTFNIKLVSSFL